MLKRLVLAIVLVAMCTGCLGRGALNREVKKLNLNAVENRWGREGIYFGLQALWVYRVCTVLDLFIFNSIEFWSGKNPINGGGALAELPLSQVEKIGFREIEGARVALLSGNEAKLQLHFQNGDRMTFDVLRHDADYTISYQGRVFFQGKIGAEGSVQP
jgi:hypothetical protein